MTPNHSPRSFGRPPALLKSLAEGIEGHLFRALRERHEDSMIGVRAYWLREDRNGAGYPNYACAYIQIVPVLMSDRLCEVIESLVRPIKGVVQTGRHVGCHRNTRPLVWAVVDLTIRSRRSEQ